MDKEQTAADATERLPAPEAPERIYGYAWRGHADGSVLVTASASSEPGESARDVHLSWLVDYGHPSAVHEYVRRDVAERERAEVVEDCGQDVACGRFPGCNRHWEERNRELARAALAAEERAAAAESERDRLRKIFDDAGQGEHNVLALIDYYQQVAIDADERAAKAEARIADLRAGLRSFGTDPLAWEPVARAERLLELDDAAREAGR